MRWWDVHRHWPEENEWAGERNSDEAFEPIYSLTPPEAKALLTHLQSTPKLRCSVGIHPWFIEDAENQLSLLDELLTLPMVVALGECGLDASATYKATMPQQMMLLQRQIERSEALGMPLILHLVKTAGDLLYLKRLMKPSMPWVVHGFRGKPTLCQQLLDAGMILSFGPRFNHESLQLAYDAKAMLVETDMARVGVDTVYDTLAQALGIETAQLAADVEIRAKGIFAQRI